MEQLIVISTEIIGAEKVNSVNARELHENLGSKQDFSTWIKNRIYKYGFVENEDYITLHKKVERQILIEYIITLDMAKELAMVENNEKGRQARKYFIQAEKNLREISKENFPSLPFASQEMNLKDERLRKAFYKAFGGKCYYTKKKLSKDNFHIDHIMPRSLGGRDTLSNLVLCDPSENSRKLNSYDRSFVEHHQAIVTKEFAPLVYAIYISSQGSLVAPGVNPTALLTAPMMTKMEKMFGMEATREFYAKLIPGIELKSIKRMERDDLDRFMKECIIEYPDHKTGHFTTIDDLVEAYLRYCEVNQLKPLPDRKIRTQLKKRLTIATTYHWHKDGKRKRCLTVDLVNDYGL